MSLNNKRERERNEASKKATQTRDMREWGGKIFNKKKKQICSICYFVASLARSLHQQIFARIGPINTAICIQITQS